jgi:phosphatidylserine/phosphatidylglycerophosphate/cardiolipin synthase-like enzyme
MLFFLRPGSKENLEILEQIEFNILDDMNELCIAVAYFTEPRLTNALIKRHELGYKTRLILNTSDILRVDKSGSAAGAAPGNILRLLMLNKDPENTWIRSLGRKDNAKYENMHHKFLVSTHYVYFGSLNWTRAALNNNFEVMYVSRDIDIVEEFRFEFNHLWNVSENICVVDGNRITGLQCSNCGKSDWIDVNSAGYYCGMCGESFSL